MTTIGTPFTKTAKKVVLCGSGELGKEVVIELMRYGVEVVAIDSYANAPAMQVATRSHVCSMLDSEKLRAILEIEKPDLIIPEVEAIATEVLVEFEQKGFTVIPTAKATKLTMNREGIRRLAAEELGLKTSSYKFAGTKEDFENYVKEIGIPCVIKPIMSSSGKGQSYIKNVSEIEKSWQYAQEGARGGAGKVIIEGFVKFDYEITLLTVRHIGGTSFCAPIGHRQEAGDYKESWQPQIMSEKALKSAQEMAKKITDSLGGFGLFGVEFFVCGDEVIFSEVSPRPHDTGMVTLISQNLSEFALHARAVLGLPIPNITNYGFAASAVITAYGFSKNIIFGNLENALEKPDTQLRLFGKPEVKGERRMGVGLALGKTLEDAKEKANFVAKSVTIELK